MAVQPWLGRGTATTTDLRSSAKLTATRSSKAGSEPRLYGTPLLSRGGL
jgi:hypothetical protein